ncbi:tetraacyldisaccharide 4'-kinase [Propionivibrio sp.]|uniref:tetraacyldisaccharide 4'-kinase n=1 Tax=Propionivibrio sp. TaxID=2212460 RepID=UPI0025E43830|nr:tetraacyldisaccharide 4'-kinase [Propionivibrio sp.]MBK7357012.1 tetraacyldisaccharide 4'-kinase [Propionivibrio sp.]MBK8401558.1 tetraacyldisaccharide 4'-kinase [Propionivibrio sp.]MBK8745414.1 tetraacyldisaccharide 4'-kinase [Propionivibrio sp.]MBK8894032.1 tetraacyldisaccharide 4'-kinase [Propionivibrio sp.]MBL0209076.1 tetraacyldisaccharide 4'-kinase [Propionivibrio sp.]
MPDCHRIAPCLTRLWYRRQLAFSLLPLLPLSWLFRLMVWVRYALYRCGVLRSYRLPVPVIVVGNLTVGGSGKTPLVLWLVDRLRELGWRPGIVSRGYGGAAAGVQSVGVASDVAVVGDEPLLLARRAGVPVSTGRDRVAAGQALLAGHPECNVIVSDDGLQHYRLQRAVEIAVFDGRGPGNSRLLPVGPLREPLRRLSRVTAVVWNSAPPGQGKEAGSDLPKFEMRLVGQRFHSLLDARRFCAAEDLHGKRLFAMAGIGDPNRFFAHLKALGLEFEAHAFPDHHEYKAADLAFAREGVLLMTEKDAVKCAALASGVAWVLPVEAQIVSASSGPTLLDIILEKLDGRALA